MLRGNKIYKIEIIKMCGGIDFEMFVFFLLWCSSEHAEFISVSLFHNLLRLRDCHPIFFPPETSAFERENVQIVHQRNCGARWWLRLKGPSTATRVSWRKLCQKGDQLHHHFQIAKLCPWKSKPLEWQWGSYQKLAAFQCFSLACQLVTRL